MDRIDHCPVRISAVIIKRMYATQRSFSDLEYAGKRTVTGRDRFLGEINSVTPWTPLTAELISFYPKIDGRGRPPIGLLRMLRTYIAQQCIGLFNKGIEDAIYDSHAALRPIGVDDLVQPET
jgi:IS5 family transposase